MKNILNNFVTEHKKARAARCRALIALLLLSSVVASTVVWSLRIVGTTLTTSPVYETASQRITRGVPAHSGDNLPLTPASASAPGGGYL